ncbi:MAG TPA: M20/M25/M40 family metallo-hydrolase [Methylomirabilota bacterium]|jgi:tripeptide aminopeptidase|nr:M20/M25/M40 family metallo-hydrolase [Methylomirabilota bacterium]
MIKPERIKDEFLELASISSMSRREGAIARRLESILKSMGASVEVDDAGEKVGGETGNILARFAGTKPDAPPFLLSAHMDTVGPAEKIHLEVEGDIVHTDRTTVLGGDDKAGIVSIFEAIRVLREEKIPHGDIEVILSICEETGLLGAKHFDTGRLRAKRGLVLDVDGVCELITRAPVANRLSFTLTGLEAHAGICPERGLSAIQIASEAIAGMKLGRVDAETTANLGRIQGGLATNIVPTRVVVDGETRSLSVAKLEAQTEHMRQRFEDAAARHAVRLEDGEHRARVEVKVDRQYERLDVADTAKVVTLVAGAAKGLGKSFRTRATGGGSDANVYTTRGIEIANLACGMRDIHTVHEWVDLKDLYTTASIVLETVRLNAVSP